MGQDPNEPQNAESQKPIVVTVLGTGTDGTGSASKPAIIQTPDGQPNIEIKVVKPLVLIGVRALRVFFQSILALLTAGPATGLITAADFGHLVMKCASLSVAAAGVCVLQNAIELLARFDQSNPTLAG